MLYRATVTTVWNLAITDTYIIASSTMQVMKWMSNHIEIEEDSQIRIVNLWDNPIDIDALQHNTTTEWA